MKMRYDREVDALFIELVDAEPISSFDYEDGVTAIVDAEGRVIAIEVLDARGRLEIEEAEALTATS